MIFLVFIIEQFRPEREVIESNDQRDQAVRNRSIGSPEYVIKKLQNCIVISILEGWTIRKF
jgi:hypothetical protein